MPKLTSRVPSYRKHKASGQAVVSISGKDYYLGPHGTTASKRAYDRLICEYLQRDRRGPASVEETTMAVLIDGYREYAKTYYVKGGTPTQEFANVELALRYLASYVDILADDFGPLSLRAVQEAMVSKGLGRSTVNHYVGAIKRMFRWGVTEELVSAPVVQALRMTPGLRKGRTAARESQPVMPVDEEAFQAAILQMSPIIADMVRLQQLTGMRPSEVCRVRPCDIDRSGEVWIFCPNEHKTAHHDHARQIFIGPKGQEILFRYLARDRQSYCFSPIDNEARRQADRHAKRKTPMSCGNTPGSNRKRNPKRTPRERYSTDTYRRAIHRACDSAGINRWSPNRLRHSAATKIRREFGLEAAQVILGHSRADVTQVYAERDTARGIEIARRIG